MYLSGEKVSPNRVREALGNSGSLTDITDMIGEFHRAMVHFYHQRVHFPGLPEGFLRTLENAWTEALSFERHVMDKEVEKARLECDQVKQALEHENTEINRFYNETLEQVGQLQKEMFRVEEQKEALLQQISQLSEKLKDTSNTLQTQMEENSDLLKAYHEKDKSLSSAESKISSLEQKVAEQKTQIIASEDALKESTNNNSTLQQQVTSQSSDIQTLTHTNRELQENITAVSHQLEKLRSEHVIEVKQLRQEISEREAANQANLAEHQTLNAQVVELRTQKLSLQERVVELNKSYDLIQGKYIDSVAENKSLIKQLNVKKSKKT